MSHQNRGKRLHLSRNQKIEILDFYETYPTKISQEETADHFRPRYPKISQAIISRILAERETLRTEQMNNCNLEYSQPPPARCRGLYESIIEWHRALPDRIKITDAMICDKATAFANGKPFTRKMLEKLKNRYPELKRAHRQATSSAEVVDAAKDQEPGIQELFEGYNVEDMSYIDHTGVDSKMYLDFGLATPQYFPQLQDLTGRWTKLHENPLAHGGSGFIYKARLEGQWGTGTIQIVAVKVLRRMLNTTPEVLVKRVMRETSVWSKLNHDNITPLIEYGVSGDSPCMISPWYENGSLPQYIARNSNVNKSSLVSEVLDGLIYLHSFDPPVVHADLKPSNILIDNDGHARLTDFGLSRMLKEGPTGFTTSSSLKGTFRWMAPELFQTSDCKAATTKSDIYAICLSILEIYTGRMPFSHLNDMNFYVAISKPTSPDRSNYEPCGDITEGCWSVFERGWSIDPEERPNAASFKVMLHNALVEGRPSMMSRQAN
ncbi:hypothetical protein FRC03_000448 [Tulasnella sp. 419]|nr:hypothetical protein FRC03_000448 [Tulasnella sp. 419]